MTPGISTLDWVVIALYFVVIFVIAGWAIIQERKEKATSAGYFLAGRNVGWFVVGASLFASNIGSEHLVGLAGTGASDGLVLGQFELQASLVLLLLGWLFVPFYIKSGVFTMPEFLERRYSSSARWYLSIVSIIGYVLTKISVTIYAGGVVFETLLGLNFWTGALTVVLFTGVYTILGGLRAVVYTDLMQAVVLILGATSVTVMGLIELGGIDVLVETAGEGFFDIWKPMTDPEFPWTGIAFGAPIIAVWYWCTDQYIVQRALSARGIDNARRGTILAGYLKQLPLFLFVLPGIIAYSLAETGQLELGAADQALPALVGALLPTGFRGLVVAGLLAALMSSLSSVFNSCSTLITLDIYKKLHPAASERRLVLVGRLATTIIVVLGILWIPFMDNISGTLYQYLQSVQGYISPPIAAVFLLGVFWKRINAPGAIASLLTGFVLGMGRLAAELNKDALSGLLYTFADINFMHFAIFLFIICVIVLVAVSLMTPPPAEERVAGLTFATADQPLAPREEAPAPQETESAYAGAPAESPAAEGAAAHRELSREEVQEMAGSDPAWRQRDKVFSIILVVIVVAIMIIFA